MTSMIFIAILAVSIAVMGVLADNMPSQVHIALAGVDKDGNPNGMAIGWQTANDTKTTVVKYGTTSGKYDFSAEGSSAAYYETFNHHVVLKNLSPSSDYFYIVGDEEGGWSSELQFKSAPLATRRRSGMSFAVFADLGSVNGEPTINYVDSIKDKIDLVWHGGDVSYADDSFLHVGCLTKFCYEEAYNKYMNMIQSWASKVPYMVAPGNHEADCHDPACILDKDKREKLSNFTAYNGRFRMPSLESGGVLNMHYSFNYGPVHFISLDTETGYPGAAEETRYVFPCGGFGDQLSWLEKDLQEANRHRDIRPWIFAIGHHPMYQGESINQGFQTAMENLFYKYGVDIYFSGHVHSYERDYPVYQGNVEMTGYDYPKATTHLMIGGAGNDEMRKWKPNRSKDPAPQDEQLGVWKSSPNPGPWTAARDQDEHVGIGRVNIIDDSTLVFEYVRTLTGRPFDTITLKKDHSIYPLP